MKVGEKGLTLRSVSKAFLFISCSINVNTFFTAAVKMFGWESKIADQMSERRDNELVWLKKRFFLGLLNMVVKYVRHSFSEAKERSLTPIILALSYPSLLCLLLFRRIL